MPDKKKIASKNSPPPEGWPQAGVGNTDIILTTINGISIFRNFTPNLPADTRLRFRARSLRKRGNIPEVIFWQQVHKGKFHQIDFDRQRIVGTYIVDFYIKSLSLVIEIDGSSHNTTEQYDLNREKYLENLGLQVYRISAGDISNDVDRVMKELENFIISRYSGI